jgi:hypothetical protein
VPLITIREKLKPKRAVMKKVHLVFLALLSLLLILAGSFSSLAGSGLRCSGRIISVGDTQDYVLDKCGEPTSIEEKTGELAWGFRHRYPESHEELNHVIREIQIEVWTYNLGSTQFIRYLKFRNGKLVDIRTGGYGN